MRSSHHARRHGRREAVLAARGARGGYHGQKPEPVPVVRLLERCGQRKKYDSIMCADVSGGQEAAPIPALNAVDTSEWDKIAGFSYAASMQFSRK